MWASFNNGIFDSMVNILYSQTFETMGRDRKIFFCSRQGEMKRVHKGKWEGGILGCNNDLHGLTVLLYTILYTMFILICRKSTALASRGFACDVILFKRHIQLPTRGE